MAGGRGGKLTLFLALTVALASGCGRGDTGSATPAVFHVGYQKSGNLALLKSLGFLEERLAARGIGVKWTEFPAGPQLLEAMNVGGIDFGHTGDSPPIFAQSAGASFLYVAASADSSAGSAILVPADSPLRVAADLRGKKVAFTKGSSAHYLVIRALESVGLSFRDIVPIYLSPSDARAAFERKSVDAWSIWDPYLAAAERGGGTRVLLDGTGLVSGREFYLVSERFHRVGPEVIAAVIEEIGRASDWGRGRARAIAERMAPEVGLDVETLEITFRRRGRYDVVVMDAELVREQQRIADAYLRLGLIPRAIAVAERVAPHYPSSVKLEAR